MIIVALPTTTALNEVRLGVDSVLKMIESTDFKTRKAWNEPGHSHFLTFSTYHKRPYLLDPRICKSLAKSINRAAQKHEFAVLAYVFMPDHVHMTIFPRNESYDMCDILWSIKQGPSQVANNRQWIETNLWQPGGGHDSNVANSQERINNVNYIHQNPVRKGIVEESHLFRWSSANWYLTGEQGEIFCTRGFEIWE